MKKTNTIIKIVASILTVVLLALALPSCSEAEIANANLSKQADYFGIERKIIVYNARTDLIIFEAEGFMSVDNNAYGELVITCKTGPNTYKKNFVYLNDYTLYAVEDISGTHTDPYHYHWYFHTKELLPEIEVK